MSHRRFVLAMLKLAGMLVVWIVCCEWMSLFAKSEYAEEVHTGNRVQTYWRTRAAETPKPSRGTDHG